MSAVGASRRVGEIDRCRRVGRVIARELAGLIAREVDDERARLVSITEVTVSRDLKQATVYVSRVGEGAGEDIEGVLNGASQYLRYLLGRQAGLRSTPSLRFKYDDSIRRGVELSGLIDRLNRGHAEG